MPSSSKEQDHEKLVYWYITPITLTSLEYPQGGVNVYGHPSLGVVGGSQSSRSNDITLTLTTRYNTRFCDKFSHEFHWPIDHTTSAVQPGREEMLEELLK